VQAFLVPPLPSSDQHIVFTNPDNHILFPEAAAVELDLPKDGSPRSFNISGETGSGALNDTVIEARQGHAGGELCGEEDLTVFHFDDASVNITVGGVYRAVNLGTFTLYLPTQIVGGLPAPARGVTYSVQARIRPAGVNCGSSPQTSNLRIGILQNLLSTVRTVEWDTPRFAGVAGPRRHAGDRAAALARDDNFTHSI
jgi:hypothetical protein